MFNKKNSIARYRFEINQPLDFYNRRFFSLEGQEYVYGWVDFSTKDTEPIVGYDPFHTVKLRIDKRSVPGKLLNEQYEIALKELIKQQTEIDEETGEVIEEYIPSKTQKKELKAAIKNRILREVPAVPSYVDVVFDMNSKICYVFSTKKKDLEFFEEIASEQVDLKQLQFGGFVWGENEYFEDDQSQEVIKYILEHETLLHETMDVKFKEADSAVSMVNAAEEYDIKIYLERGFEIKEIGLVGISEFKISDFYLLKNWEGPEIVIDEEDWLANVTEKIYTVIEQFEEIDKTFKEIWEKLYE